MSYHHQLQHRSSNHIYLSPSMNIINSNDHTRDLGITMLGDCSFNENINLRTKQCRQLTGWILRTFKSRDKCTMVALFKSLVLPRLEHGCQLWSPTSVNQINAIENIQRKFTKHITGMHSLPYENRLKHLKLYSLMKIMEGIVPNLSPPICVNASERRGRLCVISSVERCHIGTLAHSSFRWKEARVFNALPSTIRNCSNCDVLVFNYLALLPDIPCTPNKDNSITGTVSGVSRILFRGGGGVQNFSGKVGVFAWREARGVRGHAPPRKFFKMVQFGAF